MDAIQLGFDALQVIVSARQPGFVPNRFDQEVVDAAMIEFTEYRIGAIPRLQIHGPQSRLLCHTRQHPWPNFHIVMKRENKIGPPHPL